MSFNKVILSGYVGRVDEMKKSKADKNFITFSLATDSGYGENKKTHWHKLMAFDNQALTVSSYITKGSQIIAEGEVTYSKYTDKNGVEKDQTTIMVRSVSFLGKKPEKSNDAQTELREEQDEAIPF